MTRIGVYTPAQLAAKSKRAKVRYTENRNAHLARSKASHDPVAAARRSRASHERKKAKLNALKDRPCVDCGGEFHPAAMDFDHVRGEKKYEIGTKTVNRPDLAEELAKCELRCANCHRTRHAGGEV